MGLRERKRAATRAAIATAAEELILSEGFEHVTAEAIADRAGVSRATFFRAFATKEHAFFASGEDDLARFRQLLADAPATASPTETLRTACLAIARDYVANRVSRLQRHRVVRASRGLADMDAQMDAAWESALAGYLGESMSRRDAATIAGAFFGTIRAVLRRWFERDGRDDLVADGERAFALLRAGIDAASAPNGYLAGDKP